MWTQQSPSRQFLLWGAPIADLLPTGRRSEPESFAPQWRHFPETGHYLAHGFRASWEQYGDLAAFGFPLTEEFDEYDPELGQFRTVQYFERARFSWLPKTPGAINGVVLNRVGVLAAQLAQLDTTRAFRDVSFSSTVSTAGGCWEAASTKHHVCGLFRTFWLEHGLVLRDGEPVEYS